MRSVGVACRFQKLVQAAGGMRAAVELRSRGPDGRGEAGSRAAAPRWCRGAKLSTAPGRSICVMRRVLETGAGSTAVDAHSWWARPPSSPQQPPGARGPPSLQPPAPAGPAITRSPQEPSRTRFLLQPLLGRSPVHFLQLDAAFSSPEP